MGKTHAFVLFLVLHENGFSDHINTNANLNIQERTN